MEQNKSIMFRSSKGGWKRGNAGVGWYTDPGCEHLSSERSDVIVDPTIQRLKILVSTFVFLRRASSNETNVQERINEVTHQTLYIRRYADVEH